MINTLQADSFLKNRYEFDLEKHEYSNKIADAIEGYLTDEKKNEFVQIINSYAGSGKTFVTSKTLSYFINTTDLCFTYFSTQQDNLVDIAKFSDENILFLNNKQSYCINERSKKLIEKYGKNFGYCDECIYKDDCEYKALSALILSDKQSSFAISHKNYEYFYEIFKKKNGENDNRVIIFDEDFSQQFKENLIISAKFEQEILQNCSDERIHTFFTKLHSNIFNAVRYFLYNIDMDDLERFEIEYDIAIVEKFETDDELEYKNPFSFFKIYYWFIHKMSSLGLNMATTCHIDKMIVFECYNQIIENGNLLLLNATFNEEYLKMLFANNDVKYKINKIEKIFTEDTKLYAIKKWHKKEERDSTYPESQLRIKNDEGKYVLSDKGKMCCELIKKFIEDEKVILHTEFTPLNQAIVVCKKSLKKLFHDQLGDKFIIEHFGNLRGKNTYQDHKIIIIIGTLYENVEKLTIEDEFKISKLKKRKDEIVQCMNRIRPLVKGNKRAILLLTSILNEDLKDSKDFTIFNPNTLSFKNSKEKRRDSIISKIPVLFERLGDMPTYTQLNNYFTRNLHIERKVWVNILIEAEKKGEIKFRWYANDEELRGNILFDYIQNCKN